MSLFRLLRSLASVLVIALAASALDPSGAAASATSLAPSLKRFTLGDLSFDRYIGEVSYTVVDSYDKSAPSERTGIDNMVRNIPAPQEHLRL